MSAAKAKKERYHTVQRLGILAGQNRLEPADEPAVPTAALRQAGGESLKIGMPVLASSASVEPARRMSWIDILVNWVRSGAERDSSQTLLHQAAQAGDLDTVMRLVEKGEALHAQDEEGQTPLHLAAQAGDGSTVKYLIRNGASVHFPDTNARTPLHVAAKAGKIDAVEYLLVFGADPAARDSEGKTPLTLARESGDPNPKVIMCLGFHSQERLGKIQQVGDQETK